MNSDGNYWSMALGSMSHYIKDRTRTIQDVEKEIEDLKKRIDDYVGYELQDRLAACLNHSVLWHKTSEKSLERDIAALEKMSEVHKGTDWAILHALFTSRLAHDKEIIVEHEKLLAECVEWIKTYSFTVRSRELKEELKELMETTDDGADPEKEQST